MCVASISYKLPCPGSQNFCFIVSMLPLSFDFKKLSNAKFIIGFLFGGTQLSDQRMIVLI